MEKREIKLKALTQKLEEGVKAVFDSENYKTYLRTMSKFHNYSINNSILIASQCPVATYVCGYRTWEKEFNRHVNKGEKGIMIYAPRIYKKKDEDGNEEKVTIYRATYVFDISQTSGDELPKLIENLDADVSDYQKIKKALVRVSPTPIDFEPVESSANGYYSPKEDRIVIDSSLSELQTVKTMIHEISHATLKHGTDECKTDRFTNEVQAESIAFLVTGLLGLDTSDYSFGYISSWSSDKEIQELKDSLEVITETSQGIFEELKSELSKEMKAEHTKSSNISKKILKK